MISISMSDLLVIPELSKYSEKDLIPVIMDEKVLPYLYEMGLDKNKGYCVDYNIHRNLQDKVVEGYKYVGEIRIDSDFRHSPFCGIMDRIIIHGTKDIGFALDLARRLGSTINYTHFEENDTKTDDVDKSILNPDWEESVMRITQHLQYVDLVRGCPTNSSGLPKLHEEWLAGDVVSVPKKNRVH